MEPALEMERRSLPHHLRRPKGPGLLLRGGPKDTARLGGSTAHAKPRWALWLLPSPPTGRLWGTPADSHTEVCRGPSASPSAHRYLPQQSLVEKSQNTSVQLASQHYCPNGARQGTPLPHRGGSGHAFFAALVPQQAEHHAPHLAPAPSPNAGTESLSPESPATTVPKCQVSRAGEDPTKQGNTNLSPACCGHTEPLPSAQHLEAQQKLP